MEDQEKGYEVIDKRGNREEPVPEQETAEEHEHEHDETMSISVYGLLQWFVAMLSESAWQTMGIQMNPATKKVEKDMAQAKAAVDTIVFIVDQLAPHVPEEQRRAYRGLVSDLRVNFVQQSEKE